MLTLRFHEHGDPADVLRIEETEPPQPGPGQIRVAVRFCGLTPADWALCGGLFQGNLPRGIGLEISGTVDALGEGVSGVQPGDAVFGPAPYLGPTAGASEFAVLDIWFPRPPGLDPAGAAALPMAVETAYRSIDSLGVTADSTVLIHGAGTTIGFAAAQIAALRGARVISTAGHTHTEALRKAGAEVTSYADGFAERVTELAGGPVDLVLDTAPVNQLAELLHTVKQPHQVLTVSNMAAADALGVRPTAKEIAGFRPEQLRNDVLGEYAQLAAEGRFSIPVARIFPLAEWTTALELSRTHQARGKLLLKI